MPRLVRLYILHSAIGFALSAVLVAALVWADVAQLGRLVVQHPAGPFAAFLLWVANGIVLAGAQFGIALTLMSEDGGDGGGGAMPLARAAAPAPQAVPVAIPVAPRRRP
jgi:hypothetical protein